MKWLKNLFGSRHSEDDCACSLHANLTPAERARLEMLYAEKLHEAYTIAIANSDGHLRSVLEAGQVATSIKGGDFTAAYLVVRGSDGKRHFLGYTWDFIEARTADALSQVILERTTELNEATSA